MIRSMTGFAEKGFHSPALRVRWSIKSLNHRFFDWTYKGAPIGGLEQRLRVLCQERARRGRIEVGLDLTSLSKASWDVLVNEGLLDKVAASLARASRRAGAGATLSLDTLFRIPQLVEIRRKDLTSAETRFLEGTFLKTLGLVLRAREREGTATWRQLRVHIGTIEKSIRRVERLVKSQPALIRKRVASRVKDLNPGAPVSKGKISEETAYLAQRYDMAEEVLRLKTHARAIRSALDPARKEPVGRTLDFLAQELYREANTVNSKSQDLEIIRESLVIKGEIESIRQHVQNIE
ncbi:MAG: YicC family protein [Candidatus Aminicenantes bacterium]|nr:YicC family protein [Candidatus Aminicenantes bacterium]